MSSYYAIMKADRRQREDVRVDRRINRAAAERIAREHNAQAVREHGPRAPLFYVERVETSKHASEEATIS